jgi:hypothetical protein
LLPHLLQPHFALNHWLLKIVMYTKYIYISGPFSSLSASPVNNSGIVKVYLNMKR